MAANVTVSFFDPADINGTPILTITDEDTYFKGFKITPDLYGLGGWQLTLARSWGFALFGSGAVQPEVFVRYLIHAYSDTDWYGGGVLQKRAIDVVQRDEIGAEELVIGGPGPKQYIDRYRAGIEQLTGTGFNLDLANGVWRWNENATSGRILNRFIAEDQAHSSPALPDLTRSFNDTHDSDGVAWVDDIAGPNDWETPIGNSLLQIVWDLEDLSEIYTTVNLGTVSDPTYRLDAVQSYGSDVTGTDPGTGIGILREGLNIANDSLTVEGVGIRRATHVIVEGKDGVWVVEVKPTFSPGDYKKLAKIEYPRSSSEAILHKAGLRWLRRQDNGDQQLTCEILPGADEAAGLYFPSPTSPVWIGNTVTLDTVADGSSHSPLDYNNADQLVTGLELELGPAGSDTSADAMAKSWDVKVHLNHERAGFGGSPDQLSPGTEGGDGGGCKCLKLCKVHIPGEPASEIVTVDKQFNGGGADGGDALTWTGLNINGPGGGAAGSSNYYFKSTAPNEWSNVWAGTAGEIRRISGFVGVTSGERLKIGFFNAGVGSPGGGANLISEHTLAIGPAAQWTSFLVEVTTPVGTVGWALGRDGGGPDFDQITVATVVYDAGDGGQEGEIPEDVGGEGDSGTGDSAARCDHVHAHGNLSDDEAHHHDWTQLEADYGEDADISNLEFDDIADAGALNEVARADHIHGMPADPGSVSGGGGGESWETVVADLAGKVHRWKFEEASGNFADAIGSLTLTASGSISYQQASPLGFGASFAASAAGTSSGIGSVPIGSGDRATLIVWKTAVGKTATDFITYGTSGSTRQFWNIDSTTGGGIRQVMWADDIEPVWSAQDGDWHLTVGNYYGPTADHAMLYHDGSMSGRNLAGDLNTTSTNFVVAGSGACQITDIIVWDRPLIKWEMDRLYDALRAALA